MVSLGPLHHRNIERLQMEKHKARAVNKLLIRLGGHKDIMNSIIQEMMTLETSIRSYYEEVIEYSAERLAWMMTMDSCFLLEILRASTNNSNDISEYFEPIFNSQRLKGVEGFVIFNDILTLENQIPQCALQKVYEIEMRSNEEWEKYFFQMVYKGLLNSNPFSSTLVYDDVPPYIFRESKHLLDVMRLVILSNSFRGASRDNKAICIPCYQPEIHQFARNVECTSVDIPSEKDGDLLVLTAQMLNNCGINFKCIDIDIDTDNFLT
eukprot:Gb_30248 [translate_table: standard]